MRNIEHKLLNAIRAAKLGTVKVGGNTTVETLPADGRSVHLNAKSVSIVRLYGHHIGTVERDEHGNVLCVSVSFAGYLTATTRSRVNATLEALPCIVRASVAGGVASFSSRVYGDSKIGSKEWTTFTT